MAEGYECPQCGRILKSKAGLTNHLKACDGTEVEAEQKGVKADVPKEEVLSASSKKESSRESPVGMRWISVNKSELKEYQDECILVGYNPETKEALVKE